LAKIAILGAGVTGVTSAYALLQRGHEVVVLDRLRYPAMETSYANGGQLSASNSEVWNSWPTVVKGLRWILRQDAPLLLNPWPSLHKYTWLAEFGAQMGDARANTLATTRLAIAARAHLFRMAEAEGVDFDLEKRGLLHFYYDKAAFEAAERSNAVLVEGGLERYAVTRAEIRQIEPALRGEVFGGLYTPSDASGDMHKFTRGLAAACARKGAVFQFETEVEAIEAGPAGVSLRIPDSGAVQADAVLVCAGVASRRFAHSLGDRVNIYPVKGYSITLPLAEPASRDAAPWVALLDESSKIVSSRLGRDRLRIAGTAELNGYNKDIRADRIAPLLRWCEQLFPGVETSGAIPWAGLRPMTPTMLPKVGRGRRERVFYNTGHGHLGWTLSAATAELAAEAIDRAFSENA
jgi:D-amino-acid dehydrogenase